MIEIQTMHFNICIIQKQIIHEHTHSHTTRRNTHTHTYMYDHRSAYDTRSVNTITNEIETETETVNGILKPKQLIFTTKGKRKRIQKKQKKTTDNKAQKRAKPTTQNNHTHQF